MPSYIIFLIIANRPEAKEDDEEVENENTKDPAFRKMLKEFLDWMKAEIEAGRIKDMHYLLDSNEETNIRIDFHGAPQLEKDKPEEEPTPPPPSSSVKRGHQKNTSANILNCFSAEFSTVDDAIAWGRSCPIAFDGLALEIRQVMGSEAAVEKAPPEEKEWIGDHILSARKKLVEEGKMKKEEDGTQWVKLEDPGIVKELVADAKERDAQKENN